MERINEVYAFVYTDDAGVEQLVQSGLYGVYLIARSIERARELAPHAQRFADRSAKSFRLVKFSDRADVTEELSR